MTVHMTIELDDSEEARVRALAEARAVSPEDVLRRMISERLSYEEWFGAEVQKGLDELDSGRVVSDEEVWKRSAAMAARAIMLRQGR